MSFLPCFCFDALVWRFDRCCSDLFVSVPDWQPRVLLGMVSIGMIEARSVNDKNTHTHTQHTLALCQRTLTVNAIDTLLRDQIDPELT